MHDHKRDQTTWIFTFIFWILRSFLLLGYGCFTRRNFNCQTCRGQYLKSARVVGLCLVDVLYQSHEVMTCDRQFKFLPAQKVMLYCLLGRISFQYSCYAFLSEYFKKITVIKWVKNPYRVCISYELDCSNLISCFLVLFLRINCIIGKHARQMRSESNDSLNIMDPNNFILHLISPTFYFKIHMFFRDSKTMQSCLKENCPTYFYCIFPSQI